MSIWGPYGKILEAFWAHLAVANRVGGSMDAPFMSEIVFPTKTPGHFGRFWAASGHIFENIFVCFWSVDFAIGFHLLFR